VKSNLTNSKNTTPSPTLETESPTPDSQTQKHYFASSQIYAESMNYKPMSRPFTKEQIEKALLNPLISYQILQQMSNYLYQVSSAYQNTIDYFSNILAFDYVLSPTEFTDNKITMMNRLLSAAKKAKQSQVKTVYPKMIERALVQGEAYFYTLTDNENTIYVEIPAKFCEVYEIDSNNLFRYKIRLDLLNNDIVKSLPLEIKEAYNTFHDNKNKSKKNQKQDKNDAMDSLKYKVSENGFAILTHGMLATHDYPYFANMFIDLLQLEEDKEYLNSYIRDDNVKMVHNLIPTNDEGVPLMPEPIIRQYHESDKNHVPKNVSVSTTPFKKEAISFDSSSRTQINLVEQSKENVQDDSGVSSLVFNNEKASSNALKDAIQADTNRILPLLKFFNAILSYQIKQYKFCAVFLENNRFNRKDNIENSRTNLQFGGNRMDFMVSTGKEIYDFLQISKLEKMIDIDEFLPIQIPGSQQSGLEDKKNGRPVEKNPSDSEEINRGYD
jgi:hypothetical protein